ncbi:PAS domain S-box protein [Pedobacter sp. HMF7647]|uniref:histidine kinase n=1 Tax=Hufsiella arboris TaxID=2695275 RepID=A0A7K1YAX3_9SPHI|nr:PAS domain S-box protein [Hufsiella arboris]MXV51734.1 PAS domain S-box protein [Hufsiella arboris]
MQNEISEKKRLQVLEDYQVMDTGTEKEFDAITRLASYICSTPVALITLIDSYRQWFKSKYGTEKTETSREIAFCRYTILGDEVFEVADAFEDDRFANNPLVTGDPNIRFYAGAPLISPSGYKLGSLCVIDTIPRNLTAQQKDALQTLADEVITRLEVSRKNRLLEESLNRYVEFSTMFNTSGELHCVLDDRTRITLINQTAIDILGYTESEAIGKSIWDFCLSDDCERIVPLVEEGLRNNVKNFEIETRIRTKQGEIKWISWTVSVQSRKWFVNGRDVTEHKEIAAQAEMLSAVASKIDNGVIISKYNEVVWVNAAFEKITGYNIEEIRGKKLGDILRGEETDIGIIEKAREYTRNKKSFEVDILAYRKDGAPIWLSVMNSIILGPDGEIDKEVEIITDITERKRSEIRYQTLSMAASKTSTGVVIRSADGELMWMNKAVELITGYSLEDVQGKQVGDLLVGEKTNKEVFESATKALKNHKSYTIELEIYRKTGEPLWVNLSNDPIFDDTGKLERHISIITDITERKAVEMELIKTREEAIALSKSKEMYLSVMSHEIRTPISAVVGLTNILLDDKPKESQLENLNILKFSAENLLLLLNDILDFSKIENGKIEFHESEVNLKMLTGHIIDTFQYSLKNKNVVLKADIDPELPEFIIADQTRIYQIIINLIGNSVKFTNEGEISLSVKVTEIAENDIGILFKIRDTGIGIQAEKLEHIFEAYAQAETDIATKYGGTGLGLPITKKLIELYGSEIFVNSEVGKGSEFSFEIKFKRNKTLKPELKHPKEEDKRQMQGIVLVVDDNEINRLLAKKMLSKWGLQTDFAENGREALEKIGRQSYDIVLMDIQMPVLNGIEAARQIRTLPGQYFSELPIVALTASIMNEQIEDIKKSGMDDYLLKPFSVDALFEKIDKYLHLST